MLVLRVWLEDEPEPKLRARVTRTVDLAGREEVSSTAGSAEEILSIVRAWIEEFVTAASGDAPVTDL